MPANRRKWLKQIGLGIAGMGVAHLKTFASPETVYFNDKLDDGPIRLSSNENPYGPSPLARIAMAGTINSSNRYGWDLTAELITAIAKKNGVTFDNVLIAAGSTQILDLLPQYVALKKGSFVLAKPTYSNWSGAAKKIGLKEITVPLTPDKRHNLPAMLKAIEPDTTLIYLCNPNNPTGTICERNELVAFIKEATKKALVLVDEAYLDFTDQQSLSSLVIDNKNLVIAKTFSKIHGLAGARIGYAIAHKDTIEQLSQLVTWPGGSIGAVSAAGALASLVDEAFVKETYLLNEKARKYTIEQLERLHISCIPSSTNFIYFSLANYKKDFFEQLKINNIQGTKIYEEQGKWSRITVGTMKEMERFVAAVG